MDKSFKQTLLQNLIDGLPLQSHTLFHIKTVAKSLEEAEPMLLQLKQELVATEQRIAIKDWIVHRAADALTWGSWLASSVRIPQTHTEPGQSLLNAFYIILGKGSVAKQSSNLYRNFAAGQAVELPRLGALSQDERISESDLTPAIASLWLGHCGSTLMPEILGYHFAKVTLGLPWQLAKTDNPVISSIRTDLEGLRNEARQHIHAMIQQGIQSERVCLGIQICLDTMREWIAGLPQSAPRIQDQMLDLLKARRQHAFGFHGRITLNGKSLDDWFSEKQPADLLDAFAGSQWIIPGNPDSSPFLKEVHFGGRMFGVFKEEEIAIVRDWILSLKTGNQSSHPSGSEFPESSPNTNSVEIFAVASSGNSQSSAKTHRPSGSVVGSDPILPPSNPRGLYHMLLNLEQYPDSRNGAHAYVQQIFRKTRGRLSPGALARKGLLPYRSDTLQQWLNNRITDQVHSPLSISGKFLGTALTRADLIWALIQLTPGALVDGGWLQSIFTPTQVSREETLLLLEIYRDELGSGKVHQHHGNVMRHTLTSQGQTFPEADSVEFYTSHKFSNQAFAMPAYWLSISEHHREFFPELLGLNLAVEIAGVGQGYGAAVEALRMQNIDPYFFELHNTIDNAATGHTALSVKAIQVWLESLSLHQDSKEFLSIWQRIWLGFYSYETASRPLSGVFARRFWFKLLRAKLSGKQAPQTG
ncbi:MAG: iron-containing redox enzyme family protein [Leptospirales bacterium]|nr:iron-containing redox enzyme family protein [Leptospirales bacterium]